MFKDKLAEIEYRLALTERELETTRAQVRALETRDRPRWRMQRGGILGLAAVSVVLFAVTRPVSTEAQGGPKVLTVKAPFQVVDASGKVILRAETGPGGRPSLTIGDLAAGHTTVGVGASGSGFVMVGTQSGADGVALGQYRGSTMGAHVFGDNNQELVTLSGGQKGGSVKVITAKGLPVAAMLAGDTGGGLALTGPAGGQSAVSLSVEPSGGKVKVFPQAGGPAQAELSAGQDGGGALNVYNKSGEAVAWLEATGGGNGLLEIGRAGKIYVHAAVLENGLGVVIAGPNVGGPPPGLVIPYYLEGRKKQ